MYMENKISDKSLVTLLFKTIKEFTLQSEMIVSDFKKYDKYKMLSYFEKLDTENKYIKIYIDDDQQRILSVQKPMENPLCPEPNKSLFSWIKNDWEDYKTEIAVKKWDEKTSERFEDDPERVESFHLWIDERNKWIKEKKRLNDIDQAFKFFYMLLNTIQNQTDEKELLYTFGLFLDKTNKDICHPLFTKQIRIGYENIEDNIITLFDTDEEVKFESAFLKNVSNVKFSHLGEITTELENTDIYLNQEDKTAEFLKKIIHYLTPSGEYLAQGETTDQRFVVSYTPMIILRNKHSGFIEYLEKAEEAISGDFEIPSHLIDLLHPRNKDVDIDISTETLEQRLAAASGEAHEIFMTKPANKAQLRIAQDIEQNNAVEVQGPPGTGKTHTIANLIGHFLAQGKTILVTSEKIKALTVLRDKLDEAIRPLCVPVFDGNSSEMNDTITAITSKVNNLKLQDLTNIIKEEKDNRNEISKALDTERKIIFNIHNKESQSITYEGQGYSVIEAAQLIAENKNAMEVIPGSVKRKEGLPLADEDFQFLYASNTQLSADEEYELSLPLPDYSQFMLPDEFKDLLTSIESYLQKKATIISINLEDVQEDFANDQLVYQDKLLFNHPNEQFTTKALKFIEDYVPLKKWQIAVVEDSIVGGGYQERWQALIAAIDDFCDAEQAYEGSRLGKNVAFDDSINLNDLLELLPQIQEILKNGGFNFFNKIFKSNLFQIAKKITIDGHALKTSEEIDLAVKKTKRELSYHKIKTLWEDRFSSFEEVPSLENISGNIIIRLKEYKDKLSRALSWQKKWYVSYMDLLKNAGFNIELFQSESEYSKDIHGYETYLINTVGDYIRLAAIFSAEKKIQDTIEYAKKIFGDTRLLQSDLCNHLLKSMADRNSNAYEAAYNNYIAVFMKKNVYAKRNELLQELDKYAFDWSQSIRHRTGKNGQSAVPVELGKMWMLKQFEAELDELYSMPLAEREQRVDQYSLELRRVTTDLANNLAWYHLKRRLAGKQEIQSAVATYASLIKQAGKRKGKRAPMLLKQAREQMKIGQNAVPVWIIPVRRALETFDPGNTVFDVAIIDEASQSSLEALVITLMARKIIVVGDDKQVSPMMVGVSFDERDEILEKYLGPYLKNSLMFDGRTSFYEIVSTAFKPVMLEEHFRCVPEIIGYSNEKMYNNKILPLRDSHSSTLLPPVINYRVDGKRNGVAKTNAKEAECIVSLMMACWEQPEYEGKTFGIISLLGDEQATAITELVYNKILDAKVREQRQLVVGNAASFQGDERDIMFLSMVDDNESARRSCSTLDFRRRYNVAASRAKDQLWVVNSLDYAQLKHGTTLEDEDVRFGLLEYSDHYQTHRAAFLETESKADSPFEAEVAKYLLAHGYHIQQQYEAGPYRIDIVVFYENKKIAIECDGERFHSGSVKIEEDMERQCILQRIGWKFIRIRGGMYYRDKEVTMANVLKQLGNYGIFPEQPKNDILNNENEKSELYERVVHRAEALRNEWHKKDRKNKQVGNEFIFPQETSFDFSENANKKKHYQQKANHKSAISAVMSPQKTYHASKKEIKINSYINDTDKKRKITMGDKVTIEFEKESKTYIMMKNNLGSLTELTQVCLGHSVGDTIIYQGGKGIILNIK